MSNTTEFQPTRPCGARPGWRPAARRRCSFNPRARVGRDCAECADCRTLAPVSTHAPVWGATGLLLLSRGHDASFNPRARVGRDLQRGDEIGALARFQPTRPCGARPRGKCAGGAVRCFNPRARVGRDGAGTTDPSIDPTFQPTRPCGARPGQFIIVLSLAVFQPTRPCGARHHQAAARAFALWFQPTRPCGARLCFCNSMSPLIEEPMNCEPNSHIDVQAAQAYSTRQNPLFINDIAACELVRGVAVALGSRR